VDFPCAKEVPEGLSPSLNLRVDMILQELEQVSPG